MFVLYFGGQKSGKSKLAEQKTLKLANNKKPFYIATYDNSYDDVEMENKILEHKHQRNDSFDTIEEKFNLNSVIQNNETYLIDCISMWILNNTQSDINELYKQLETIFALNTNVVFVLNDINSGVIPIDKYSRDFVDKSGLIGQKIASFCDEVYEVKMGIEVRIK